MEVDDKDSWKRKYKHLKIVRLKTEVECFSCRRRIPSESIAVLEEGNFFCTNCRSISSLGAFSESDR